MDVSVTAQHQWPKAWPLDVATMDLQGMGSVSHPIRRAKLLTWSDAESHCGYLLPYILPYILISLWGSDMLQNIGPYWVSPNCSGLIKCLHGASFPLKGKDQGRRKPLAIDLARPAPSPPLTFFPDGK